MKEIRSKNLPRVLLVGTVLNSILLVIVALALLVTFADPMVSTYTNSGVATGLGAYFVYPPTLLILIPALITAHYGIREGRQFLTQHQQNISEVRLMLMICRAGQILGFIALSLIGFVVLFALLFITSWNF